MTARGPGQERQHGAQCQDGAAPAFPGKGDLMWDRDFPPKGGGQIFISDLQWLCETEH